MYIWFGTTPLPICAAIRLTVDDREKDFDAIVDYVCFVICLFVDFWFVNIEEILIGCFPHEFFTANGLERISSERQIH